MVSRTVYYYTFGVLNSKYYVFVGMWFCFRIGNAVLLDTCLGLF